MNAEAIMTPGGLAAGFQGLANAAMNVPVQMQQNRMHQQQLDMDRMHMQNQFEQQKMQNAFQQQQFSAQQQHQQFQEGLETQHYGLAEQQAQDRHAADAFRMDENQMKQIEQYGLGAAQPTGPSSFQDIARDPGQAFINKPAMGGDAFSNYSPKQMAAGSQHEMGQQMQHAKIREENALASRYEHMAKTEKLQSDPIWHARTALNNLLGKKMQLNNVATPYDNQEQLLGETNAQIQSLLQQYPQLQQEMQGSYAPQGQTLPQPTGRPALNIQFPAP